MLRLASRASRALRVGLAAGLYSYAAARAEGLHAPAPAPRAVAATPSPAVRRTLHATAESAGVEPAPPDFSGEARTLAALGALLSLLPGAVGVDLALHGSAGLAPRALLGWPLQVPLGAPSALFARGGRLRTAALSNHRLLLEPELLLGPQRDASGAATTEPAASWAGVRTRVAYRFVWHPRGGPFGVFVGAGLTGEWYPWLRPAGTVELGARWGGCCHEPALLGALALRLDAYPLRDERVRLGATVGWSFY